MHCSEAQHLIGHVVNVQSCLLIIFQYQPISLRYSWLSVEQPVRIDWVLWYNMALLCSLWLLRMASSEIYIWTSYIPFEGPRLIDFRNSRFDQISWHYDFDHCDPKYSGLMLSSCRVYGYKKFTIFTNFISSTILTIAIETRKNKLYELNDGVSSFKFLNFAQLFTIIIISGLIFGTTPCEDNEYSVYMYSR